jgi:hypothetical protein
MASLCCQQVIAAKASRKEKPPAKLANGLFGEISEWAEQAKSTVKKKPPAHGSTGSQRGLAVIEFQPYPCR